MKVMPAKSELKIPRLISSKAREDNILLFVNYKVCCTNTLLSDKIIQFMESL